MSYLKKNKGVWILTILSIIALIPYEIFLKMTPILGLIFLILKPICLIPAGAWLLISPVLLILKLVELVKARKEGNILQVHEKSITILILILFLVFAGSSIFVYGFDRLLTLPTR
jgi:hypothetical protein